MLERDFEDVAAVVDAVAEQAGEPVLLWGHSYGANGAMEAATLTGNVSHLVLYEPSLGLPYPPGAIEHVEAALARGHRDEAIAIVLVDILELTEEELDGYRASPLWPERLAAAGTIPVSAGRSRTGWSALASSTPSSAATLLLTGSSVPVVKEATARAIPGAEVHLLEGPRTSPTRPTRPRSWTSSGSSSAAEPTHARPDRSQRQADRLRCSVASASAWSTAARSSRSAASRWTSARP